MVFEIDIALDLKEQQYVQQGGQNALTVIAIAKGLFLGLMFIWKKLL